MAFGQSIDQRKLNKRNHIVELFRLHGDLSKAQVRQLSGYSMDTVISLFKSLEDDGYIGLLKKDPAGEQAPESAGQEGRAQEARSKGRPAELYRLNYEKELYAGVTFNQSGMWSALVSFGGTELDTRFDELPELGDQAEFERRFEQHFAVFVERNRKHLGALRRVGLALPGRIDADCGCLLRYNLMPFINNLDLRPIVNRHLPGVPVSVQHNITGLASMLLREKELISTYRRILYVSARSGAAHALIQDGRIVMDDGEMGHMTVSGLQKTCRCGRVGCLDTVFSAAEFHRLCPHSSWAQLSGILAGSSPAAEALRPIVEPPFNAMAEALMNLSAAFSPDLIVLSGELFSILPDAAEWVRGRIRAVCAGNPPPWIPRDIAFRQTSAASAAVGLCRTFIDQEWSWHDEHATS
jgi:predicted NBD/HSP70 family sugar kinase